MKTPINVKSSLLLSLCLFSLFVSCKKEDKRQYSEWFINDNRYSSNNVEATIGKSIMYLAGHDNDRFSITFNFGSFGGPSDLPTSGAFPLRHSSMNHPDSVAFGVYTYGNYYVIRPGFDAVLTASLENKKAVYTLAQSKFVNYYDSQDTVIIHGIFREP